ncbi:hypothetical protein [Shewanella sp. 4_MG-2023]|uniref:hypothetical protein n=1 Tax=Shewanella sp. 4_MG-2023 TaxID=3062652 RepID=UPI0026E358D5|nr:hypothetical protein [Shewanella sp. 4_MG-2023]MDO6678288.1 hypothetical protein [Shewanella sp. 4_MG-2023]
MRALYLMASAVLKSVVLKNAVLKSVFVKSAVLICTLVISQPLLADTHLPFQIKTALAPTITPYYSSSFSWISISNKQAIVCDESHYPNCLNALPVEVVNQLPKDTQISAHLGAKTAMVLAVNHHDIAGIIIVSTKLPLTQSMSSVNGLTYRLALLEQFKLTLWHEVGHLENIALIGDVLPSTLSAYQHEWLADMYLVWRIAQTHPNLDLAWQQFHRRNMDLINNRHNMSHWSSPQLQWLLSQYQLKDIQEFDRYSDFIATLFPQLARFDDTEIAEISSLVQRTFGRGATLALPKYIFWRQQRLIEVISPTLVMLMGEDKAHKWLVEQFSEAAQLVNKEAEHNKL